MGVRMPSRGPEGCQNRFAGRDDGLVGQLQRARMLLLGAVTATVQYVPELPICRTHVEGAPANASHILLTKFHRSADWLLRAVGSPKL